MDLTVAWLVFPLVLLALCLGCGLLVERLTGTPIPGALVPVVGLAADHRRGAVPDHFGLDRRARDPDRGGGARSSGWLSSRCWRRRFDALGGRGGARGRSRLRGAHRPLGQATFAGYIKLDDTATWMALTDRVMEHGRSLSGLAPSTYEATLAFNLGAGYPVGVFLPLGIGAGPGRAGRRLGDPALHGVPRGARRARRSGSWPGRWSGPAAARRSSRSSPRSRRSSSATTCGAGSRRWPGPPLIARPPGWRGRDPGAFQPPDADPAGARRARR